LGITEPFVLHFEDSGKWCSIPDWAEYFISVGRQLASAPQEKSRLVTAIIVPTRAYGAAFVSLGMVVSDASSRDADSEASHFEKLFDLAPGTPVVIRPGKGKALKGLVGTPEERDGKLWIRVQVHSTAGGGLTHLVDESRALQVQPAGGATWKLPKKQGDISSRTANRFVDRLLGETDPVQLGVRSKIVCALVGRRNTLEHEIRTTPLSIHVNGNSYAEGKFQDVLRVNRFVNPQQSHRTALVPIGSEPPSSELIGSVEMGVVFDGASGFLKWGAAWQERHQVVVLDRTDPYFEDAISAINARFSKDHIEDGCVLPDGDAPPGSEILTFREAF
jgi:hypothetical protein